MLIKIQAHTGVEYVNPAQITHVSEMRGYMLMHFANQAMIPIDPKEWERVRPVLTLEAVQNFMPATAEGLKRSTTAKTVDDLLQEE